MPDAALSAARITPLTLAAMLGLAMVWGLSIPITKLVLGPKQSDARIYRDAELPTEVFDDQRRMPIRELRDGDRAVASTSSSYQIDIRCDGCQQDCIVPRCRSISSDQGILADDVSAASPGHEKTR
jgi:hypothetical protein